MGKVKLLILAGIVVGSALLFTLLYIPFLDQINFDYSKVTVVSNDQNSEYLTDKIVRRAVDAALADLTTKIFFARFDNPGMHAEVGYLSEDQVYNLKYTTKGNVNPEYAFLPDSSPVLVVAFDTASGLAIPEHPRLEIFLEPETYRIHGSQKSFWN